MPQPAAYAPNYDYSDWSTNYPTTPHSGARLDTEFSEIASVTEAIIARLELIQRDDGEVANLSIGLDQLKPEIVLGVPTDWVTATAYEAKNVVWQSSVLYVCNTDHTSGVFATDLGAGKWTAYLDYADPLGDAAAFATAASASATTATAQAVLATTAKTAAVAAQAAAEAAQAAAEAAFAAITFPIAVADGGSGATTSAQARTNWGIGTGDSPTFAGLNITGGIEVGNADTTVTRSAAGVIAVEGVDLLGTNKIGVTVQGYDADTVFRDVDATVTAVFTHERAVDANLVVFSNTTTTHDMLPRFASAGTLFELTPAPSGAADAAKGFGYDYTNLRWFADTNFLVSGVLYTALGGATAPSLAAASDTNTGFYWDNADGMGVITGGLLKWIFRSGGAFEANGDYQVRAGPGSAALPGLTCRTDTNTGIYFDGSDKVLFAANGGLVWDYNASRVLLNTSVDLQLTTFGAPADTSVGPRRLVDASITTGTPVAADSGKRIICTGGVTIPASVFAKGDTLIIDAGASSRTITQGASLTLTWEAVGTTGNRTLAANGRAIVTFESATTATISGSLTA